jgi:hypothetical protein
MCTVSFVPTAKGIIITSNRDEKSTRPIALPPKPIHINNTTLYYPTDITSSGTWFIVNEKGDTGVLLNGAFVKHQPKAAYSKSRGSILPFLFQSENPLEVLNEFNFNQVENCTLVLYVNKQLVQAIWDGVELTVDILDEKLPYIWSSVTLYDVMMIAERRTWFNNFLYKNLEPSQQSLIDFHTNTGKENKEFGLQMNRNNAMLTVSITSVAINNQVAQMQYTDILQKTKHHSTITFPETIANNSVLA